MKLHFIYKASIRKENPVEQFNKINNLQFIHQWDKIIFFIIYQSYFWLGTKNTVSNFFENYYLHFEVVFNLAIMKAFFKFQCNRLYFCVRKKIDF